MSVKSMVASSVGNGALVLVGNPNVGKSALFGRLTGQYVTVSNYPGTTVELSSGHLRRGDHSVRIIDTPGVNNLIPSSEDEEVTRDILLSGEAEMVIQVADAKNLRRGLLITLQLAEMNLPFVLAVNMEDEARRLGMVTDVGKLSDLLGIPVRSTVAIKGEGLTELREAFEDPTHSHFQIQYDPDLEEAVAEIVPLLPDSSISRRSLALMLLAGDETLDAWQNEQISSDARGRIDAVRRRIEALFPSGVGYQINRERMATADALLAETTRRIPSQGSPWAQRIADLCTHPVWGVPILLAVLYIVYEFVGIWGAGTLVGLMENTVFGKWINPTVIRFVNAAIPFAFVRDLLVGEYGIITMAMTYAIALVLPIVATFFLAFGFLEDSGYLPRLAVMSDRVFKLMGLNGKAVLPMILGLGCDTMATLTTRILESKKERVVVTLLLSLGVPCSAQLGVILAMLGQLSMTAMFLWLGVVLGVIFIVGWAASKVLPGDASDFVLELPPLRLPQLKNIVVKTAARIEWYLKEAVPLFVVGTLLLFLGARTGALEVVERVARPVVVGLLGLPGKSTDMFVIGFLRRDYGAAGFYTMAKKGQLDSTQMIVSLIAITLFLPCIAQFFVTIKERGMKTALGIAAFTLSFSIGVASTMNFVLRHWGISI